MPKNLKLWNKLWFELKNYLRVLLKIIVYQNAQRLASLRAIVVILIQTGNAELS